MLKRYRLMKIELLEEREKYLLHLIDNFRGGLKDSAEDELVSVQSKLRSLRRKVK